MTNDNLVEVPSFPGRFLDEVRYTALVKTLGQISISLATMLELAEKLDPATFKESLEIIDRDTVEAVAFSDIKEDELQRLNKALLSALKVEIR
ncbi:hypothetical protein [Jiella mangrovi]|uniref:Uncharacterized protein n=1 Tax=Jiella mangrovi TaxID=2821407 RepID=A0ABS4BC07_9HYPH|nr:hypothetical protein [Jiella mangrovi]MBP0614283.1 hypothetical protein [Jiella mangrovi]